MSDTPRHNAVTDPTIYSPAADETVAIADGSSPSGAAGDLGNTAKPEREKRYAGVFLPGVIVGFILALAVIIFLAQNTNRVEVSFLGWNGNVALAIVVIVVAFVAVVIDEIAGVLIRRQVRKVKNDREELKRLRKN